MKHASGFTLIELMIVVAIIGILAAIAVPAYQNYIKRAYVADALQYSSSVKAAVLDYVFVNGDWPTDNQTAGVGEPDTYASNSLESITIDEDRIELAFTAKVSTGSPTVILEAKTGAGGLRWTCDQGTLSTSYRPSICR